MKYVTFSQYSKATGGMHPWLKFKFQGARGLFGANWNEGADCLGWRDVQEYLEAKRHEGAGLLTEELMDEILLELNTEEWRYENWHQFYIPERLKSLPIVPRVGIGNHEWTIHQELVVLYKGARKNGGDEWEFMKVKGTHGSIRDCTPESIDKFRQEIEMRRRLRGKKVR